jgi:hypothetical protein
VWHHRRPSVLRYLRQQAGYGVAEAQLEHKHPDRFNLAGFIRWNGRVYAAPRRASALLRPFIYHGHLGTALFQTLYQKEPAYLLDGPATIQWYAFWIALLALSPLSWWLLPVGVALLLPSLWVALVAGLMTEVPFELTRAQDFRKVATIAFIHFVHPVVRTWGRVTARLRMGTPPRKDGAAVRMTPRRLAAEAHTLFSRTKEIRRFWGVASGRREEVLRALHVEIKSRGTSVQFGQEWDNFDLVLSDTLSTEGRVHSAPEQYDQALCFGFRAATSRWAFVILLLAAAEAAVAAAWDARLAPSALVPVLVLVAILSERARLRARTWDALDAVMKEHGAKRFGEKP